MLIDDTTLYEKKHSITVNNSTMYYYFDYDERSAQINMEFQHFHSFYEIFILLAPEADYLLEGKSYHLQMGDMLLLKPYCLHKSIYKLGPASKRIIINFMYPNTLFELPNGYLELLCPFNDEVPIFRFSSEHKKIVYDKLNDIFKYSRSTVYTNSELNQILLHSKFIDFLYTFLQLKAHNIFTNETTSSQSTKKMYEISSYIHSHFHEELSLNTLANRFYLSPYYLSHQFKKVTHFTVSTYIQMTRIKNAQHLLLETNQKITDIAHSCGFTSFTQFNRVFNKMLHLSPREFRKNGYRSD